MKKENLILVHSFPTNSKILCGFKDFLDDYFNVYFIDLPGFICEKKPLEKISIECFSKYLDKEIEKLNLKNYFLGGISFGFLVVNETKVKPECKGILAIEPYLNSLSLNMNYAYKTSIGIFSNLIRSLSLEDKVWNTSFFRRMLEKGGSPEKYIDIIISDIHPRTFFSVLNILLKIKEVPKLNHKNYILLINKDDATIAAGDIIKFFKTNAKDLNIFYQKSEHYPKNVTKAYFKRKIPRSQICKIIKVIEEISDRKA